MAYKDNEMSIYKDSLKTFSINFNLTKYMYSQKKELEMIKSFLGSPCPLPKKPQSNKQKTKVVYTK